MARGLQSFQEMKACSHVLLPVHTRVGMCVSLHVHTCACGWVRIWALVFIHVYICSHVPLRCVSVHACI